MSADLAILTMTQLQLEHAGYPPGLVQHAIDRARGMAEYKARPIRETIRGQAYLDILVDELAGAEKWMGHIQQLLNGEMEAIK